MRRYGPEVGAKPRLPGDRARQALLLGPGVALAATGLVGLLREPTAVGWTVLVIGVALLSPFSRGALRVRSARVENAGE